MIGMVDQLRVFVLMALAWAVIAQAAPSSPTGALPADRVQVNDIPLSDVVTIPTIGSRAESPASDGLLRERTSIPGIDLDQSHNAFTISTTIGSVRTHLPNWLPQAGARPTYAIPSVQILFCTWLA